MTRTLEDHLLRATNLLVENSNAGGFATKAARKDALEYASRAYEAARDAIREKVYKYRDANNLGGLTYPRQCAPWPTLCPTS